MLIRKMQNEDIGEVQSMMKELQDFHADMLPQVFKKGVLRDVEYFKNIMTDDNRIILVAVNDIGEPIGFVKGKMIDFPGSDMLQARKYGYVDGIFVKKVYRGRLVEYKLQKELFKWFKSLGLNSAEANVYEFNGRAKEYYQLFGYSYIKHGLQIEL